MGGRPHTRRDRCSERAGLLRACEGGRGVRCSHLPTRSRPPRPRRQHEDEVDPAGLEVRGQGEGPDPADHCTWPCARLCWPGRRRWVLRARVAQPSGSAGARVEAARPRTLDSPRHDEERLLAARRRLGSSSIATRSRPERQHLVLLHITAASHLPAKAEKGVCASKSHCNPLQHGPARGSQGPVCT